MFLWDPDMSYLSYSAYILNILYINLTPLGVFMVFILIKRVPEAPMDSLVNSKLSPWNDSTGLRDLKWIHRKLS